MKTFHHCFTTLKRGRHFGVLVVRYVRHRLAYALQAWLQAFVLHTRSVNVRQKGNSYLKVLSTLLSAHLHAMNQVGMGHSKATLRAFPRERQGCGTVFAVSNKQRVNAPSIPPFLIMGGSFLMKRFLMIGCLFLCTTVLLAQVKVREARPKDGIPGEITDRRVTSVEPVLDPSTVVSFDKARLADMTGKRVKLPLKGKVTIVEYWSRSANKNNLYWNRMRELEHKFKDRDDIQIISINYDNALGGEPQRKAVTKYFESFSEPKTVYVDLDDGVREMFSLTGPTAYMLFNEHSQYIFTGRADAPETEKLFKEIDQAIVDKKKWDDYVEKVKKAHNKTSN